MCEPIGIVFISWIILVASFVSCLMSVLLASLAENFSNIPHTAYTWWNTKRCRECRQEGYRTHFEIRHKDWCVTGVQMQGELSSRRRYVQEYQAL